ncbi:MAG: ABC transporter ATP-binding protein [Candidatus Jacksonbacteria bacterium]|nr:ABC transporter ATP-binding protein [Candidatus Jacksonbacteria bacterium]
MTILEIKNLTKHFDGVAAIDRLSFSVAKGTITGIIGPNGSGKTTLTNILSGMIPKDGGAIVIDGVSVERMKSYDARSYGITRTFQNVRVFEQMTVFDNLLVVVTERNVWSSLFERHVEYHHARVLEVLERIGLSDKKTALARTLSYGQRKLLEVGRALLIDARVYLFDEPFAGLFPEMAKRILSIIHKLKTEGKTVILIEHNMELVRELCDTVIVMDSGRLLSEGDPEKVLKKREVLEAYLGE